MILSLSAFIYVTLVLLSLAYVKTGGKIDKKKKTLVVVLSVSNKYVTNFRLKQAVNLNNSDNVIVICGKRMSKYMRSKLNEANIFEVNVQDRSMNTYEDAKFLLKYFPQTKRANIVLVSSLSHQRRAYNTFSKFFSRNQIVNRPSWGELLSVYSPFLPSGWLASLLNMYKDLLYNRRVL